MRGAHPRLEAVFDETYKLRPAMRRWTRHSKPAVRKPRQALRRRSSALTPWNNGKKGEVEQNKNRMAWRGGGLRRPWRGA
jgi:hypothetical protein